MKRERLRIAVVGCGLVSQVMHLPHLRELDDRYEVVAVCDVSRHAREAAGRWFPAASALESWQNAVDGTADAVLVATAGSHAPIALAAAELGKHVLVEKPLCYSEREGVELVRTAERAGVFLMVAYMKRYDPAYEALAERLVPAELRLARITTLESPIAPYAAHHRLVASDDVDAVLAEQFARDNAERVESVVGTDDPLVAAVYERILLSSMVHEFNAVRGLLGEPSELRFADFWGSPKGVTCTMAFQDVECIFAWVDLPGLARYEQELPFFAPDGRATLRFPSPFLRNMPTELVIEGGTEGTSASWSTRHVVSFEEAFKREFVEFHAAITEGREPRTGGRDGLADVVLAEACVRAFTERAAVADPTVLTVT